jgi:hypothetical protein
LDWKRKGEIMRQVQITYIMEQFGENWKEYVERMSSDRIINEFSTCEPRGRRTLERL